MATFKDTVDQADNTLQDCALRALECYRRRWEHQTQFRCGLEKRPRVSLDDVPTCADLILNPFGATV